MRGVAVRRMTSSIVSVDRRGLGRVGYAELTEDLRLLKEPETPLGAELASQIKARGPVTVHEYMRQCLLHPRHGYYARPGAERVIGKDGDFITAPEVSQLFGELVGVWLVSEWLSLGKPSPARVVEVGPGRGTLMADVLQATTSWPEFRQAVRVEMVEASPSLRTAQQLRLGARPLADRGRTWRLPDHDRFGTSVRWHESLRDLDDEPFPCLLVAQELLDAMPAHQFVKTPSGWREKLVDVDDTDDSAHHFRFVLAPSPTPASRALTLSSYLAAYDSSNCDDATIEVSPTALATVDDVARRVARHSGAALFVDYGKTTCLGDTLRAFKRHAQVMPLGDPGLVDLTVDADFAACAKQAALVDGARVYGPIDQGEWLGRMGIAHRLEALLNNDAITDTQVDHLITACERLCDPAQMGGRYKVLAIAHSKTHALGLEAPAGFRPDESVSPPPDPLSVISP
ncbi:hypothetical protein CTAYLR_009265 [Chrysophaeum taylorii]|uniref:Protein arginine methyltransferase NDUFAF7 n=1 Tax=Chrysophaeum taylorii TaxID=2483200 RepID=A0AAD7XI36_9STRA|nr:hypothetical protein CTAYLR_009265 [Chrysophaeum taylorii]